MQKAISFFFGLLFGAAVGWVLGTLFAPCTGEETRETLATKAIELKGRAEQAAEEFTQSVREQGAQMRTGDLELRRGVQAES